MHVEISRDELDEITRKLQYVVVTLKLIAWKTQDQEIIDTFENAAGAKIMFDVIKSRVKNGIERKMD